MQINMNAVNLEFTPQIKDYIQKKMDSLEKYIGTMPVINAKFEVEKTTNHHHKGEIFCAEANLTIGGKLLRVEKTEKDLYKAIDKVKDHMALSIKKYKDKIIDRKRKP